MLLLYINFPSHLHLIYCSTDMYLSSIKCTHINKLNNTISSHFFTSQDAPLLLFLHLYKGFYQYHNCMADN
ncbi:hypothetical protein VIGAN_07102800 [Vigna angularis var. angularis]|uniref:Uncharacterized protein n=1 Tax=Vigna angularis var. angularis TaxID=157739 RepID=A0A0S3SHR3_PHAAN|nr:hypothetical protein VIGAN_07102800 [Vigna angularis var. angularis]